MSTPVSGVGGVTDLTGNFETDLNLVMAARLSVSEQSIQGKLTAMKASTTQMQKLNELSGSLSRLAASMQTSKSEDKLKLTNAEPQKSNIEEIKTLCSQTGLDVTSILGNADLSQVTLNQLTSAATSVRQKADSIGSTSQTDQLMTQQAMSRMGQIVDQWSNMMSKIAQAKQTPISNMR
ncbi:hypothetical protein WM40_00870 [Robbsia andropogonis]|uniref:Translocator protein BipD n=1 Tax=Robbsia andropogonis TaxID=28092 RepID=A0A0F5K518_9BURK|nr:hypothetical protein [Robbsia andropogonis]KKB65221.1 hypothetical protein WM40_00870 [Robbsia andropogonis]